MPSRRLRLAFAVGLLALLAATGGCASNPQREVEAWRAWNAALVDALVARGDADSLWLAALASRFARPADAAGLDPGFAFDPRSVAWVERAAMLAPDDPLVAQVRVVVCRRAATCDLGAAVTGFRRLEPDDAHARYDALARAVDAGDPEAVDAALRDFASARRFGLRWNESNVRGRRALEAVAPGLPFSSWAVREMQRDVLVSSYVGTMLPSLSAVSTACRVATERPARTEPCRAIGRLFAASDTALGEGFGLSLQTSHWPEDSPEHRALVEARRVLSWRMYAAGDLVAPSSPFDAGRRARESAALQAELPREQDVWLAMMRRHDVPTEPPPGWKAGDR